MTEDQTPHQHPAVAAAIRELQRPVPLDPALDRRVLAELRRPSSPAPRRMWPAIVGLGLAAGVAAIALVGAPPGGGPTTAGGDAVRFALLAPAASTVTLVGDFNDWDADATPLARTANGGWSTTLPLAPGRYRFTYLVDGIRWTADPSRPTAVDDFDRPTSVVTVVPERGSRS